MAPDWLTRLTPFVCALTLVGGVALLPAPAGAGTPTLVADVATGPDTLGSQSMNFVRAGRYAYFQAYDPDEGWELWRTDGTTDGTRRVTSIVDGPGPMLYESTSNRDIGWLAALGDTVLFTAWDPAHGQELWKTGPDGPAMLLKDIFPGPGGSRPGPLTVVGDRVFFSASEPATGTELWVSDGTEDGTHLVKDEIAGRGSLYPISLTAVGGRLFYAGASSSSRWRVSDGTPEGTGLFEGPDWYLADRPAEWGGALYFRGCSKTAASGDCELWTSPDGRMETATRVVDLAPGTASSNPANLVALPGALVFGADAVGGYSSKLWRCDGTSVTQVGDVTFSYPARVGDAVYFSGVTPSNAYQGLYKTDGTANGTLFLEAGGGSPLGTLNDGLIYMASEWDASALTRRTYIKITVGEPQGAVALLELARDSPSGGVFGGGVELEGRYVLGADRFDPRVGLEPWVTDGTVVGTQLLQDIRTEPRGSDPSRAVSLAVAGQARTLFSACETRYTCRLWQTMGTATSVVPADAGLDIAFPSDLTVFGGRVYFLAGYSYDKLYWTDGAGTHLVEAPGSSGTPSSPIVAGPYLYVAFTNGVWRVDAQGGVAKAWPDSSVNYSTYPGNLTAVGDLLYFVGTLYDSSYQSVFRTNGEVGGTVRLEPEGSDLYTNAWELTPVETPAGTRTFFRASGLATGGSPATGVELWATDGTVAGTRLVRDIYTGDTATSPGTPGSSFPSALTGVRSTLFFTAWEPEHHRELWKSDGTAEGTVLVKDTTDDGMIPGSDSEGSGEMHFRELLALGQRLLFTVWSPESGVELWSSDGTDAGTVVVRDIVPGEGSSYPTDLTADGLTAFFSAWDPDGGRELWQTDGTEAGTTRVTDIAPGPASSSPRQLSQVGGALFFSATEDLRGRELWQMPIPSVRIESPPIVPEGGPAELVATGIDPGGAGLTFDWDMDGDGTFEVPGLGDPSATFSAAGLDGPGFRVVRVRVTDAAGVAAIDEATVEVVNVAPTVDAGPALTLSPGRTLARQGVFEDPGPDIWTATVDYGDGAGAQPLPLADKTFTLAHTYSSAGTYTLRVTVHDDDGGSGTATVTVKVRSPRDAIQSLIEEVQGLLASGDLRRGQAFSLIAKLRLALLFLQLPNGEGMAAVMLDLFVLEVELYVRTGVLSAEEGDPLLETARGVIAQLRAP
jgi:ELWxxDGT repeat protein